MTYHQNPPAPQPARDRIIQLDSMLPQIKARDERGARRHQTNARRREGIAGTAAEEVKFDLNRALDTLLEHITAYQAGENKYAQTPAQMLTYMEWTCVYAMRDYPREVDDDGTIARLWDAFHTIYTTISAWHQNQSPHLSTAAAINLIHHIAKQANAGDFALSDSEVE